jgi:hypothetical protein
MDFVVRSSAIIPVVSANPLISESAASSTRAAGKKRRTRQTQLPLSRCFSVLWDRYFVDKLLPYPGRDSDHNMLLPNTLQNITGPAVGSVAKL